MAAKAQVLRVRGWQGSIAAACAAEVCTRATTGEGRRWDWLARRLKEVCRAERGAGSVGEDGACLHRGEDGQCGHW